MTRNQIEFLKLQETKRANQASERETNRANVERERQGLLALDETSRHNLATEGFQANQLLETARHNLETEAETKRNHLASELELSTHNRAVEAETRRANLASEQIRLDQLNETIRSNRASESARDREQRERERANRASEGLTAARDAETRRANQVKEQLAQQQFEHQVVIDTGKLDVERYKAEEQHRSNLVYEGVAIADKVTRAGQLAEQIRSDLARETETNRHNIALELKDSRPIITLNNSSSSEGSTLTNAVTTGRDSGDALPGNSITTPKLPSGGGGSASNSQPKLISMSVIGKPYQGIGREVSGLVSGNDVQIVQERYSDGSSKYYQEVVRHGEIVSRQEISEVQARKNLAKG